LAAAAGVGASPHLHHHPSVCCSLPRHWLAVEYIWVLVPYMTYDIYVMYLCHWHKSQEKGVAEEKHSLASVRSFLLRERLMVTHHLFILIVLTPVAQVRAGHGRCAPRSPVGVSLGVTTDGSVLGEGGAGPPNTAGNGHVSLYQTLGVLGAPGFLG
uniref:TLC domain-containing protein n=1 Tax=Anas zonorhyncha TaxID=75864 RepID=A0A8B9VPA1_9AVES